MNKKHYILMMSILALLSVVGSYIAYTHGEDAWMILDRLTKIGLGAAIVSLIYFKGGKPARKD